MISQNISKELYESLKDLRAKKISEFMDEPIIANEDLPISKIIGIMTKEKSHEVFLQLSNNITYSINMRDILMVKNIESAKASLIGNKIPKINSESTLGEAVRLMTLYNLRSLPILDENNKKIIGQIFSKKIIKYLSSIFSTKKTQIEKNITAADLMTEDLITCNKSDKVATVKNIIIKNSIDHVPIVDEKENNNISIKGMVTSEDIIKTLIPSERIGRDSLGIEGDLPRSEIEIGGLINSNTIFVNSSDTITSIINTLLSTNSTYALVKALDSTLGIITYRDIIDLLGERIESEIPAYIIGLPEDPEEAELVKSKFINTLKLLLKISPEIEEARCKIKIKDITGERKRYEISTHIITPYRQYSYTSTREYDIARIFDEMSDSLKNQLSRRKNERQKESVRHMYE